MSTTVRPAPAAAVPAGRPPRGAVRRALPLLAATVVVAALVAGSLFVGVYDLRSDGGGQVFWASRVPRTTALVLAGVAMSTSGLVMQLLVQNKFVEPTTTGTTEWAALGLLVTTLVAPRAGLTVQMVVASAAAFGGTLAFLAVLRRVAWRTSLVVPLVGIMLGAVVSSFTSYLAVSTDRLQLLGTWFMGSFTQVVQGRYEVLWVVAVVALLVYLLADRLTVAGLGRDVATSLGARYDRLVLVGTCLVAVSTGVTTVVVGFLPFLGLVVPNIVSRLRGDDLRSSLPWVCLGGVALVTTCDILGRVVRMPFEVPVSMVLGIVGTAVFLTLILRERRRA